MRNSPRLIRPQPHALVGRPMAEVRPARKVLFLAHAPHRGPLALRLRPEAPSPMPTVPGRALSGPHACSGPHALSGFRRRNLVLTPRKRFFPEPMLRSFDAASLVSLGFWPWRRVAACGRFQEARISGNAGECPGHDRHAGRARLRGWGRPRSAK